jgi:hypothetical protein
MLAPGPRPGARGSRRLLQARVVSVCWSPPVRRGALEIRPRGTGPCHRAAGRTRPRPGAGRWSRSSASAVCRSAGRPEPARSAQQPRSGSRRPRTRGRSGDPCSGAGRVLSDPCPTQEQGAYPETTETPHPGFAPRLHRTVAQVPVNKLFAGSVPVWPPPRVWNAWDRGRVSISDIGESSAPRGISARFGSRDAVVTAALGRSESGTGGCHEQA